MKNLIQVLKSSFKKLKVSGKINQNYKEPANFGLPLISLIK